MQRSCLKALLNFVADGGDAENHQASLPGLSMRLDKCVLVLENVSHIRYVNAARARSAPMSFQGGNPSTGLSLMTKTLTSSTRDLASFRWPTPGREQTGAR